MCTNPVAVEKNLMISCFCVRQAVAGVKGSKPEELANSSPMYKRIQVLDDALLNTYKLTPVAMSPSKFNRNVGVKQASQGMEIPRSLLWYRLSSLHR